MTKLFRMTIAERLQKARQGRGFERAKDACDAFGWTYPTYAGHENGSRGIKLDDITRYARAYRVKAGWLAFGEGDNPEDQGEEFSSVPRLNVCLSAGHGALNTEQTEVLDHIPFTEDFVRRKLVRNHTDGLVCIDVRGESMEPTIGDGDMLIVDTKHHDLAAGIYAVNFDGECYAKRVEKVGQGFSLVSDNRAYMPISVQGEDLNYFNVIGKVLWAGKMF